ncbi:hypothetical protein [Bdellovibrio bacteriovorus]|uniref:hypothetical protein n=1 Tax=Bdellovibrio bacteriovorus TaxID=959 RepID=UPI0035A638AA
MNFVGTFFFLALLFSFSSAEARSTYLYESLFRHMGERYIDRLADKSTDVLSNLPSEKRDMCLQRYKGILDDGLVDIRIALGYFDWTTGSPVYHSGGNYGLSPSMDIGAFSSLKNMLLRSCEGRARFCGFKQDPKNMYRFSRAVQIHGKTYTARVEIQFSSATEYLNSNLGKYRSQQEARTAYAERFFTTALQEADAVFYFGHSRNGGGPDFAPPVFIDGRNKLDYAGYYKAKRPGTKRMLNALSGDKQAPIIGLMSCASRDHFLKRIRTVAPHSGIITSLDVLNVDEVFTAMIGGVDAILRGQCQKSFYESLRMTAKNAKYITMDGMFE